MPRISAADRPIVLRELQQFVRRVARRVVGPGVSRSLALLIVAAAMVIGAVVSSRWVVGLVSGAVAAVGCVAALTAHEIWRSRDLLKRLAQRAERRHVPGRRRYEERSPRVGSLMARAWEGHAHRCLPRLEAIRDDTGTSRSERTDARLAIADWWITHGDPSRALTELTAPDGATVLAGPALEHSVLRLEALTLLDRADDRSWLPDEHRRAMEGDDHLRFMLAATGPPEARVEVLNAALASGAFEPVVLLGGHQLDHLRVATTPAPLPAALAADAPMVTVIVPLFDAADTVHIAIDSLLSQTWPALEIVVVDDASTDDSVAVVERLTDGDPRLRIIRQPTNRGAYAARNLGVRESSGAYVTVNDADDWAHPRKIEAQVTALIDRPDEVANLSCLARVTRDLVFVRRGLPHSDVVGVNYSSLLVRRSVLDEVGAWDDVRVEGDTELLGRLRAVAGRRSVPTVHQGIPLSLALRNRASLSASAITGLGSHRHAMGPRRLYHQASVQWHLSPGLRAELPLQRTDDRHPFVCPPLLRRRRSSGDGSDVEHLNVVIMSDFGLGGGTTASNLTEVAAHERYGLTTGLIHNRNPRWADEGVNPKVLAAHSERARLLSIGETIVCDTATIKYPPCVSEIPDPFPAIEVTGEVVIAVNQTPLTGYRGDGRVVYDIGRCDAEVRRVFGSAPLWMPIGPAVREALLTHHAEDVARVRFADTDWVELVDVDQWARPTRRALDGTVRIGRHGRDSPWKWPATASDIVRMFPDDPRYRIDILGGADVAIELLGRRPSNWQVIEFDAVSPASYLAGLDVFVYFPHPDMVEAFGRTILEALAAGVPVVADRRFAPVFGDAIVTCDLGDAVDHVEALMADPDEYERQVAHGRAHAEEQYGFAAHLERLRANGVRA